MYIMIGLTILNLIVDVMLMDEKSVGKMTRCQVPIRLVRQRPRLFCDKLILMHLYYLAIFFVEVFGCCLIQA